MPQNQVQPTLHVCVDAIIARKTFLSSCVMMDPTQSSKVAGMRPFRKRLFGAFIGSQSEDTAIRLAEPWLSLTKERNVAGMRRGFCLFTALLYSMEKYSKHRDDGPQDLKLALTFGGSGEREGLPTPPVRAPADG